ncbi:acetate--CoA ligase family protein [Roseomonas stagni]|uniref:Acetate--CoA ligase family protein n=1 Tax=Falsiroseomonas algicola TaxID=2716930 RepID=A0A6M1LH08_9PROT|nr:acetate--CoA ligase family protein [Falsiroseomonas algicola]NGM19655.1 acetate--CoA ligase family protein [Falsiroseomonas algicola]
MQIANPHSEFKPGPLAAHGFPDLRRFFAPKAVALLGATEDLRKFGGRCLRQMLDFGFSGDVFPVNPNRETVFGRPCFPNLAALPARPDHVGIVLPARACIEAVAECGRLGIPFATVFSAGFGELPGEETQAAQAELVRVARAGGVRIMGPNCNGLINFTDGFALTSTATISGPRRPAGDIGVVGQSGGAAQVNVMWRAQEMGLGISCQVSSGNDADMDILDYAGFMLEDAHTRVVLMLAERIKDGARLRLLAARAAELEKPIALVKFGRTEAGARAAASHTGAITGSDAVFDAAARQLGLIRVNDARELYEVAMLLRRRQRPAGHGAAALAVSGGNLVALTDQAAGLGIAFPPYAAETAAKLRTLIPGFAAVNNPTDLSAGAIGSKDTFANAARIMLEDPAVDALVPVITIAPNDDIRAITALSEEADKPVAILWTGRSAADPTLTPEVLVREGHAVFRDPLPCAQALARSMDWAAFLRRRSAPAARPEGLDAARARALLAAAPAGALSEAASRAVLACYGLHGPREDVARTAEDAVAQAARIASPVALKILSPDIPHKTEAGGVLLGVQGEDAVRSGVAAILASARAYAPAARIEGVLVQEMVTGGQEMLLGVTRDPSFGPVLTIGFGGTLVEVLRDVTFRLPPISVAEATEALESLRLAPLLHGHRGAPACDIAALADAIARFSWLATDLGDLVAEIDVNPIAVLPQSVRVLDALIVTRDAAA